MAVNVEDARKRIEELRGEIDLLSRYVTASDEMNALAAQASALLSRAPDKVAPNQTMPREEQGRPDTPVIRRLHRKSVKVTAMATAKALNPPNPVVVSGAINVLREAGRPMTRRELYLALKDRGVVVHGKDPVKTVGTILWRARDQLVSHEGRGYWPATEHLPTE